MRIDYIIKMYYNVVNRTNVMGVKRLARKKRVIVSEEEFNEDIKKVLATQEIEGVVSTKDEIDNLKDYFTGKIDKEEYMRRVMEKIKDGTV